MLATGDAGLLDKLNAFRARQTAAAQAMSEELR
jgi:5-(carboxyamino)imidazole ribonucleotide mutase